MRGPLWAALLLEPVRPRATAQAEAAISGFFGPRIHFCARCNAYRVHDIHTIRTHDASGAWIETPSEFTCHVCRHTSDPSESCTHGGRCFVSPAVKGDNTTPHIRELMERQKREERNGRLRWGIPALVVLVPIAICLCVVAVRVFFQR